MAKVKQLPVDTSNVAELIRKTRCIVVIPRSLLGSVDSFTIHLPDVDRKLLKIAARTMEKRSINSKILSFLVLPREENDLDSSGYARVVDEHQKEVYFNIPKNTGDLDARESLLLDPKDERLARLARDFIEAFNASQDSGKEGVFHAVLMETGHGKPAATVDASQATEALLREVAPLGRPSGSSPPPQSAQPALELPKSPPAWWRNRQPGETADNWLRTHYKPYIDAGLLTRSFFQRKGQDKAFYNALHQWEQQPQGGVPGAPNNQLPADLYLPTKSELLDRQLEQMGGVVKAPLRLYGSTPETRQAARQAARFYQATRRTLG